MGYQGAKSSEKKNRNIHQFHIDHKIPCLPLPPSPPPPNPRKKKFAKPLSLIFLWAYVIPSRNWNNGYVKCWGRYSKQGALWST